MSSRSFPIVKRKVDGRGIVSAMRIQCHRCQREDEFRQMGPRRLPAEAAAQHFRNKGWHVGNGPRADECPECISKRTDARRNSNMVTTMEQKAEPPKTPTRDDRRIILDKIDTHYLNDEKGYEAPWTDAAIARDLGVPSAWVSAVREEFFGPARSNQEYQEFLEQAAPVIADMKNLQRNIAVQLDEARKIGDRIEPLERMVRKIEKEIGR